MRVLLVTPYLSERAGGVGVACARLLTALTEAGHEVFAFTLGDSDLRSRGRYTSSEGNIIHLRPRPIDPYWGDFGTRSSEAIEVRQIRSIVASIAPDVIHVHHLLGLGAEILPTVATGAPSAPIVYTHHDAWSVCLSDGRLVRRDSGQYCAEQNTVACSRCNAARGNPIDERVVFSRNLLSKHLLTRFVHSHYSPSKYFASRIAHDLGVRVDFLPNISPPVPEARPDGNLTLPRNRLGFFGQLTESKGVLSLIAAVDRYNAGNPERPVSLDIYGDGPLAEQIGEIADSEPRVAYRGAYPAHRASALMQRVDWVCLPSLWPEVSPIVLHEALAAGTPIIVSRAGGKQEHVAFDRNAIAVEDDSIESWADAIAGSQSPERQSAWADLSRQAQPLFSAEDSLRVTLDAYRSAISAHRA